MRRALAAVLCCPALVLTAGAGAAHTTRAIRADNGVSGMTPGQILAKVKHDVAKAKTVHVYGSGTSGGSTIGLNLHLVAGRGGFGHLSEGKHAFDMIRIGPRAYFKGGQTFWANFTKSVGLQQMFAGKWLAASATKGDLASFTPLTDITKLTNQILTTSNALTKGETTTINGHPAVEITSKDGILYVQASGPAYPLLLKPRAGGDSGKITFGEWNKPIRLVAPAKSIDYDKLTH
jgi:hypothetical protein